MEIETKGKENDMPNYLSNKRPDFKPFTADLGKIIAYQFKNDLAAELKAKRLTKAQALDLYEDMLMVREVEKPKAPARMASSARRRICAMSCGLAGSRRSARSPMT